MPRLGPTPDKGGYGHEAFQFVQLGAGFRARPCEGVRGRWALEEAGLAYEELRISQDDKITPAYLMKQPFAQVPCYEDGEVALFESGAILLHIA